MDFHSFHLTPKKAGRMGKGRLGIILVRIRMQQQQQHPAAKTFLRTDTVSSGVLLRDLVCFFVLFFSFLIVGCFPIPLRDEDPHATTVRWEAKKSENAFSH